MQAVTCIESKWVLAYYASVSLKFQDPLLGGAAVTGRGEAAVVGPWFAPSFITAAT